MRANQPTVASIPPVHISWKESISKIDKEVAEWNLNRRPKTRDLNGNFTHAKITPAASPTYRMIVSLLGLEMNRMRVKNPQGYRLAWSKHCDGVPMNLSYGQIVKVAYGLKNAPEKTIQNKKRTVRSYFKRLQQAGFLLDVRDLGRGRMRLYVSKKWLVYTIPEGFFPKNFDADNQLVTLDKRKIIPPSQREKDDTRLFLYKRDVQKGAHKSEQQVIAAKAAKRIKEVTVEARKKKQKNQVPAPRKPFAPPKANEVDVGWSYLITAVIELASFAMKHLYPHWHWTDESVRILRKSLRLLLLKCYYQLGDDEKVGDKERDLWNCYYRIWGNMDFVRRQIAAGTWRMKYSPYFYFSLDESPRGDAGKFTQVVFHFQKKHKHAKTVWMQGRTMDIHKQEIRLLLDRQVAEFHKYHLIRGLVNRSKALDFLKTKERKLIWEMNRKGIEGADREAFLSTLRCAIDLIPNQ